MKTVMELYDFNGKTAFITGASGGLGEQFARCLSAAGARVIIASRRIDKLKKIAEDLGNAKAVALDVADKKSVENGFAALEKAGETIDICVNNAGIAKLTPIFDEDENNDFESTVQTNLMGVWYVTKAAAWHMKRHNIHGSIINIGSVNGDGVPAVGGCAYSISKAAVIHLTKTLVSELSAQKIRINCISPGWFRTSMISSSIDQITPHIPYGKIANPADMDGLILYLSSNEASRYVTGSCFTIDGGLSAAGFGSVKEKES